jgi:hypothetical protein
MSGNKEQNNYISIIEDLVVAKFGVDKQIFYSEKRLFGNKSVAYTILVHVLYHYLRMSTNEIKEHYGKKNKNQVWHRINDLRKLDKTTVAGMTIYKKIDDIKLEYIKAI